MHCSPPRLRKFHTELRELEKRYSRDEQLSTVLPLLLKDTPIRKLTDAIIARAIREGEGNFRLVIVEDPEDPRKYIRGDIQNFEGIWGYLEIPLKAHHGLVTCFRHYGNLDLLLRGAVLKGFGTLTIEEKQYSIRLLFEPTDDGYETITGWVRPLENT